MMSLMNMHATQLSTAVRGDGHKPVQTAAQYATTGLAGGAGNKEWNLAVRRQRSSVNDRWEASDCSSRSQVSLLSNEQVRG